jgi:hypothetical protein
MSDHGHEDRLEPGGVSNGWVALSAAGFILLLAVSIGALYAAFASTVPAHRTPTFKTLPPPQLEPHPAADLRVLLERQRREMNTYAWANKDHTLVSIPIDRAMALIAARGEKAFAPIESEAAPRGGRP